VDEARQFAAHVHDEVRRVEGDDGSGAAGGRIRALRGRGDEEVHAEQHHVDEEERLRRGVHGDRVVLADAIRREQTEDSEEQDDHAEEEKDYAEREEAHGLFGMLALRLLGLSARNE
jgi:hypothetical protein